MARSSDDAISSEARRAAASLAADLRQLFGARLQSVVAYGFGTDAADGPLRTLALVERVTFDDLAACVPLTRQWQRRGLQVPLILSHEEFTRSLDAFALEYGAIVARHALIDGPDPFAKVAIADGDVRRACERQAKSHLIHLREGFLETGGNDRAVAALIADSVTPFEMLLVNLARLDTAAAGSDAHAEGDDEAARAARAIGLAPGLLDEIRAARAIGTIVDPTALLSRYIAAAERTWRYVDAWPHGR